MRLWGREIGGTYCFGVLQLGFCWCEVRGGDEEIVDCVYCIACLGEEKGII